MHVTMQQVLHQLSSLSSSAACGGRARGARGCPVPTSARAAGGRGTAHRRRRADGGRGIASHARVRMLDGRLDARGRCLRLLSVAPVENAG